VGFAQSRGQHLGGKKEEGATGVHATRPNYGDGIEKKNFKTMKQWRTIKGEKSKGVSKSEIKRFIVGLKVTARLWTGLAGV